MYKGTISEKGVETPLHRTAGSLSPVFYREQSSTQEQVLGIPTDTHLLLKALPTISPFYAWVGFGFQFEKVEDTL